MGLPPTSPRLKFVHTHPGGSPVPRRPPRHPPSPSTRSKSLELLDQEEKKSVLPVVKPEPVPRPRSKSLDGLLDEDNVAPHLKTEDSAKDEEKKTEEVDKNAKSGNDDTEEIKNIPIVTLNTPDSDVTENLSNLEEPCKKETLEEPTKSEESKNDQNPLPIPRLKTKVCYLQVENEKASSNENNNKEDDPTTLSSKQLINSNSIEEGSEPSTTEVADSDNRQQTIELCDNSVEPIQERLMTIVNDNKSTLLKAKSCGAGLDSNESVSSNEYKDETKEQGSLLSLPAGAEPKRKRNFMDKCVNKVRSFMKR